MLFIAELCTTQWLLHFFLDTISWYSFLILFLFSLEFVFQFFFPLSSLLCIYITPPHTLHQRVKSPLNPLNCTGSLSVLSSKPHFSRVLWTRTCPLGLLHSCGPGNFVSYDPGHIFGLSFQSDTPVSESHVLFFLELLPFCREQLLLIAFWIKTHGR